METLRTSVVKLDFILINYDIQALIMTVDGTVKLYYSFRIFRICLPQMPRLIISGTSVAVRGTDYQHTKPRNYFFLSIIDIRGTVGGTNSNGFRD